MEKRGDYLPPKYVGKRNLNGVEPALKTFTVLTTGLCEYDYRVGFYEESSRTREEIKLPDIFKE